MLTNKFSLAVLLVLPLLGTQFAKAQEPSSPEVVAAKFNPQWEGQWELSASFNKALGFGTPESRDGQNFGPPRSFQLKFASKVGEKFDPQLLSEYRVQVFEKMKHRIVATGKWKTTFEVDPGIETHCFVTEHGGSTFLWVPAPYAVLYGGKVSFLQGADRDHDVFVIDFNPVPKHLSGEVRSPDTVAFQRRSE